MPRTWTPEGRAEHSAKLKAIYEAKKAKQAAAPEPEPAPEIMPPLPEDDATVLMPAEDEPVLDVPGDLTPWGIFLAALTPETRELLDESELRAAFDKAERDAREERRQQLKQGAIAKAKQQARQLAGLTTAEQRAVQELAERNNRPVRWTVQLPFVSDTNGIADEGLLIDGRRLYHGQEVTTSWAEWRSALSIIYNLRQHELDFKGESRLSSLRRMTVSRGQDMSGVRQ